MPAPVETRRTTFVARSSVRIVALSPRTWARKAIVRTSGDHAGSLGRPRPVAKRRIRPPEAGTIASRPPATTARRRPSEDQLSRPRGPKSWYGATLVATRRNPPPLDRTTKTDSRFFSTPKNAMRRPEGVQKVVFSGSARPRTIRRNRPPGREM
jgi:hypothetical protein